MCIMEFSRKKGAFILVSCLFLWRGVAVKSASGWELDVLQKRLQEKGARWTAGETSLSHLSSEEFRQMLGLKLHKDFSVISRESKRLKNVKPQALPSSLDWRDYSGGNWITPIKNQQSCGSCYAFGTLAAMETLIRLNHSDPDLEIDFSEQYVVSCGPAGERYGNSYGGCDGNFSDYISEFLVSPGVPDEACFPYHDGQTVGTEPSCGDTCGDVALRVERISSWSYINPYVDIPSISEIKEVLVNKPVPCSFLVYDDFKSYAGGVYEPLDSQVPLGGHMVCIVGYDDSQSCWIVKNSWGTGWGESGFFRIAYNQTSDSSLTWFGLEALDFNYGDETTTTTTINPNATTTTMDPATTTTTIEETTTTTSIPPEEMPDLEPCGLSGWSYPIIPSSKQGTNTYDPATDVLKPSPSVTYVDFALCNEGNGDAEGSFNTLYIDDVEIFTQEVLIEAKSSRAWLDEQFSLAEGEHTLKLVVDVNDDIEEADESNNAFEMSFIWGAKKWPALYHEMLGIDYQVDVHSLRNFRDKVLIPHKRSRAYVGMLYKNSAQIAALLLKNRELQVETAEIIEQLLPEITCLLEGEEAVISPRTVAAIEKLLDKYEVKAGPAVKPTVRKLKKELKKGEIFNQLGIKVE